MKNLLVALSLMVSFVPALVFAEPGTYSFTPSFAAPEFGTPDGYNVYSGCDVLDQTLATATLIGAITSGQTVQFAGDSTVSPVLCVVPFDAQGNFPFDTVLTLAAEGRGPVRDFTADCAFVADNPSGGATYLCEVQ